MFETQTLNPAASQERMILWGACPQHPAGASQHCRGRWGQKLAPTAGPAGGCDMAVAVPEQPPRHQGIAEVRSCEPSRAITSHRPHSKLCKPSRPFERPRGRGRGGRELDAPPAVSKGCGCCPCGSGERVGNLQAGKG